MGDKLCKQGVDTPTLTCRVSCVRVENSNNVNLDRIDGGYKQEEEEFVEEVVETVRGCVRLYRWLRKKVTSLRGRPEDSQQVTRPRDSKYFGVSSSRCSR